jgi:hypothetical protein
MTSPLDAKALEELAHVIGKARDERMHPEMRTNWRLMLLDLVLEKGDALIASARRCQDLELRAYTAERRERERERAGEAAEALKAELAAALKWSDDDAPLPEGCGALVPGGPTRCKRCAEDNFGFSQPAKESDVAAGALPNMRTYPEQWAKPYDVPARPASPPEPSEDVSETEARVEALQAEVERLNAERDGANDLATELGELID